MLRSKPKGDEESSPELVPLFDFAFLGPLCCPLTRQKHNIFAGVLIPSDVVGGWKGSQGAGGILLSF